VKRIKRIAVARGACAITVAGKDYSWPFRDLVEFSDGVQDVLAETERLVPANAVRPEDRTFMQIESLKVQDAAEHNRNLYSGREVRDRRAEGQNIAGGDWYMEVSINGSDTDCSFNTVEELFQIVQQIITRELAASGQIVTRTPRVLVAHG
jgi:hypothetical protein